MGKGQCCVRLLLVCLTSLPALVLSNVQQIQNNCKLKPVDESFAKYMDNPGITLNEFFFKMQNYSFDPFRQDTAENYKLWRWHRTRTQHGRTLLMLSFHYDVLSLTILTIGVEPSEVLLEDDPSGCFGNISVNSRTKLIRELILNDFYVTQKSSTQLEYESHTERVVYACNSVVKNYNGYSQFMNRCCHLQSNGQLVCTDQVEDSWITLLYVCISFVKVMVLLLGPLLIPSQMYDLSYMSSQYVIKLEDAIKIRLFITENPHKSPKCKKRLTVHDISEWNKFKKSLDEFPMDEVIPVQVPELRIKVKGKRIIPENEPPTGLMKSLYDNIVRCKIKALDPFHDCCDHSVYAKFESRVNHTCTWHMFVQAFIRVVMVFLIPAPFYLRIFLYYKFEEGELIQRRDFLKSLQLSEHYDFYRTSLVQYLSPTHELFIATYICYFLAFCSVGITSKNVSEKIKSIARCSLQDMLNVERTSVLKVLLRIGLWPFKHWGLLAFLAAPFYACVMMPACTLIFSVYCLPTVYLTYRLFFHARQKIGHEEQTTTVEAPLLPSVGKSVKIDKLKKNITNMDRQIHNRLRSIAEDDEQSFPCTRGIGMFCRIRRLVIQVLVGVFCVACLFSVILLTVEAIGILVEIMAFTMMGIIVNAGSTLRYVSMALLVLVYMHDCYSEVYESYLTFNKAVINDIMDRVEDLKKVASLPSSMQENIGFTVKPVEAVDQIPTKLSLKKKEPTWQIGHLLLFLDSHDTPRIPLRLFKKLCEVTVHGAPGPVYINLLRATGKFFIIVVFLFFVMIVVMAFGNVHQISSTNQTLATLAGGFVPMLLKNVIPRKSIKLNLKTISFKGQIDEVICEFKQNWPICDLVIEKVEPKIKEDDIEDKTSIDLLDSKQNLSVDLKTNMDKDKSKSTANILEKYMKENAERKIKNKSGNETNDNADSHSRRNSVEDDIVDLLVDLSGDESHWPIYGSKESLYSVSMIPNQKFKDDRVDSLPEMNVVHFEI